MSASKILRAVWGFLAGFVVLAVTIMVMTFALSQLVPGYGSDVETPATVWILVNLAYSVLAAVAGGWVAQRIAGTKRPVVPALIGVAMVAMSLGMLGDSGGPWPVWYRWALVILPFPSVVLGGIWAVRGSSSALRNA